MNFAAARLHRTIVLLFWVPQLLYDLMTYYTVLDILINHKQEVANRKQYLRFTIGYSVMMLGIFIGSLILLGMFWRYTIIQHLL